ncbi:hypothetical protein PJM42_0087 [Salmonella phage vB_SenP_UTK0001]|nr:hypothetical protein PJM42_0087 [Salmonella phage vB_SenP_UTK0001]
MLFTHSWEACTREPTLRKVYRGVDSSHTQLYSGTRWQRVLYAGKKKFIVLL